MDFTKPPRALAPVFPDEPLVPFDCGDDETGAGSDFYVWDNILPESAGQARSVPNPMSVVGPGLDTGTSLASQLHWRVRGETDHQQVEIKVGQSTIRVDREWADHQTFELFDAALISCCCSCVGSQLTWGYVMFIGAGSAERFLQIWQRYLVPLGYRMPSLDFTARDAGWRAAINEDFRFPHAPPVDEEGLTFTARWREHREDMIEILPKLAWALRCHLRGSAESPSLN